MGNTCKPLAVSFQCMTKSTTKKKKKKKKLFGIFNWTSLRNIKISMLKSENIFLVPQFFPFLVFPTSGRGTIIPSCFDSGNVDIFQTSPSLSPETWNGCPVLYVLFLLYLSNPSPFLGSHDHYLSSIYHWFLSILPQQSGLLVFKLILLGILKPGGRRWLIQ